MTAERAAERIAHDAAMSQLLAESAPRVRAFLRRLGPDDVDDVAQETMARAWRSRHTFDRARGDGSAWLLRIAFRAFLDHRAARPRTTADADHRTTDDAGPARRAEIRDQAVSLLEQLPAVGRDILLRFHRDGESIETIARALSMPAGTVKSHLHRARNRIWALQHDHGDDQ